MRHGDDLPGLPIMTAWLLGCAFALGGVILLALALGEALGRILSSAN